MISIRPLLWFAFGTMAAGGVLLGIASVSYPRRLAFDLFFPNTLFAGERSKAEIALTFDDGPHPIYTKNLLNVLDRFQIKASFFMTGQNVEANPDIAKAVFERGHDVGNHSYSHPKLPFCSSARIAAELDQTHSIILNTLGKPPLLFRPPYGFRDWRILNLAKKMGYTTVFWDITTYDWERPGVDKIVQRTESVKNGSILLFHDGRGERSQTVSAVEIVIDRLLKKGYKFVTIGQMLCQKSGEN